MTDRALSVSSLLGEILHTYSCCIHNSYRMIPVYLQPYDIICLAMKIYAQLSTSSELASFSGKPFPVKIHVSQWSNRPGGPIRLQSSTLCDVKIPLFSPSNHIHLPTKRSHVKTWLHSSDTKFGYYHVMTICMSDIYILIAEVKLNEHKVYLLPSSFQPLPFEDHQLGQTHQQTLEEKLFSGVVAVNKMNEVCGDGWVVTLR